MHSIFCSISWLYNIYQQGPHTWILFSVQQNFGQESKRRIYDLSADVKFLSFDDWWSKGGMFWIWYYNYIITNTYILLKSISQHASGQIIWFIVDQLKSIDHPDIIKVLDLTTDNVFSVHTCRLGPFRLKMTRLRWPRKRLKCFRRSTSMNTTSTRLWLAKKKVGTPRIGSSK